MEPGRFLCIVSYWNCHIICETDDECLLEGDGIDREYSPTSMLEFCKYLYEDIKDNIDEWVTFCAYKEVDIDEEKRLKNN